MSPNHAVFTARLIRVDHKVKVGGRWAGDWGIGVVQESFWGLPPLTPHLVFIENQLSWEGETYFVSGFREYGLLTHHLPIVDAQRCGWSFSLPVAHAKIFLRLLRYPPPADQYRIMGYVRAQNPPENERRVDPTKRTELDRYTSVLNGLQRVMHLPNARVRVTGSTWNSVVTTDEDSIYDIVRLPPDNYTLRVLDPPPNQVALDRLVRKEEMLGMVRLRLDLLTVWDGSIEGTIKDVSGSPARAFIALQNPDGTRVAPEIPGFAVAGPDGHFGFKELPVGGRYIVVVNPAGPTKDSPYASIYYQAPADRQHARVIEITAKDQHIRNLDFTLRPLRN